MDIETAVRINKDELFSDKWIPFRMEIVRSPVLSAQAKILYAEIVSYFWKGDAYKAWPSQAFLAKHLSCNANTIRKYMKELASAGVIEVQQRGFGQSNEYFLLKPNPVRLQIEKDKYGDWMPVVQVQPKQQLAGLPPKVNGSKPIDTTEAQDRAVLTREDRALVSNEDRALVSNEDRARDNVASGAPVLDVAQVPAIGVSGEEEVVEEEIIEQQEVAPQPVFSTFLSEAKPNHPTIHRRDIPKCFITTWNSAFTEESVVIDGQRHLITDDKEPIDCGTETSEIDDALQNPETVEADGGNSDINVNRENLSKLLSGVGNNSKFQKGNDDNDGAPRKLSRVETLRKLDEIERRGNSSVEAGE